MKDAADSIAEESKRFWEREWSWWHRIAPPLRPAAQDIGILVRLVAQWCNSHGRERPTALLLGVTPEIACMRWPGGTQLVAVDRSRGMIDNIWSRNAFDDAKVLQGTWTALPVAAGSCDIATGDGCFSQLPYPQGYDDLTNELARVLKHRGLFAMRAFVRPQPAESVQDLLSETKAGRISSFHVFKWRLNMALQPHTTAGVRLHDVWTTFMELFGDPATLAAQTNWPFEDVETIHAYRNIDARYTFPTVPELRAKLSTRFTQIACEFPDYEMGERCPTLLFEAL
jgi:SAM-dependent methyltransferase